jgi:tRNA pseudouridine38-40 synthase
MQRYKCTISYDGTLFSGFQIQPRERTVQSELEKALKKIHKGQIVKIVASGRTDAGVHAKGQVIHFDTPLSISEESWPIALQTKLPRDIAVIKVEKTTDSFHSRFDSIGKEYRYYIRRAQLNDPFTRNYQYHYSYSLDLDQMRRAVTHLLGTHDFTSFCSVKTVIENRVRTMKVIDIVEDGETIMFRFVGDGFLYNMVRILVGTILEVGRGYRSADEMQEILMALDRSRAGKTAPPHALYLWEVHYENDQ